MMLLDSLKNLFFPAATALGGRNVNNPASADFAAMMTGAVDAMSPDQANAAIIAPEAQTLPAASLEEEGGRVPDVPPASEPADRDRWAESAPTSASPALYESAAAIAPAPNVRAVAVRGKMSVADSEVAATLLPEYSSLHRPVVALGEADAVPMPMPATSSASESAADDLWVESATARASLVSNQPAIARAPHIKPVAALKKRPVDDGQGMIIPTSENSDTHGPAMPPLGEKTGDTNEDKAFTENATGNPIAVVLPGMAHPPAPPPVAPGQIGAAPSRPAAASTDPSYAQGLPDAMKSTPAASSFAGAPASSLSFGEHAMGAAPSAPVGQAAAPTSAIAALPPSPTSAPPATIAVPAGEAGIASIPTAVQPNVVATSMADHPVMSSEPLRLAPDAPATVKAAPASVEALSLLQWARDLVPDRPASDDDAKGGLLVDLADVEAATKPYVSASPAASLAAPSSPSPMMAVVTTTPLAPAGDVAATIGASIVDMGVGGQWIDRLARDIAGLAAGGPQGSFRIDAGALGPVEVAIHRTGDGAIISLQVASDAAEAALRQDGDRLRQDAALSAVRIADLRIERVPLVDPLRTDAQGREAGQQHGHTDHQGGGTAQGGGQSAGRQRHENTVFTSKAGGERAVLDNEQARARAGDAPRARYA